MDPSPLALVKRWSYDTAHATGTFSDTYLETDEVTWLAGEYYTVSLAELMLLAPNQILGQNDSYLLGNANLSFDGTCTSTSGGTLSFTLYEVEIEGTIYLKLASTETYWLQVGTGGTDQLKMTVNLAFNPPDGEQVRSGQFTVRSRGALDVFEWDYRNRLTSVKRYLATAAGDSQQFTTPSGTEVTLSKAYTKHYVYNVYNQLVYEYVVMGDEPGIRVDETVYVLQGGQRVAVLEKTAGSYDVTHLLLPDPTSNRMLAEQYINGATSHTIWPLHDQQGTVTAAISDDWLSDQDDVQHFKYDAYGLLKFDTEQDPSLANRLVSLHAGRDWDSVSELYYNRARWYDPAMQRFISQDPLGFAAGDTNLYRYCGNSPTNATDPSGQIVVSGSIVIGAMLFGTLLAKSAESQYNEAADIIGQAEISPAEAAYAQSLLNRADWSLATANITAVAGGAYLGGLGLGALATGSYALGMTGSVLRGITMVGFGSLLVHDAYGLTSQYSTMSPVERYEAVGSFAAGWIAGYAGFRGTFGMKGLPGRRGYLNAKFGRSGNLNADINARGAAASEAAGTPRLWAYSQEEFHGEVLTGIAGGRPFVSSRPPGTWQTSMKPMDIFRRILAIGHCEEYPYSREIVGAELSNFVPVSRSTPTGFLWKNRFGQYTTTVAGDMEFGTGIMRDPTTMQLARFYGNKYGEQVMIGVGVPTGVWGGLKVWDKLTDR